MANPWPPPRRANRFYLAGPMRGFDQFNFPAFDAAAKELRAYGYEIVSPAEMDRDLGFDETSNDLTKFEELGGIEAAMHRDFGAILECDGVILLPGWRHSTGSRAEVFIAQTTGRLVYEYVEREDGGFFLDRVHDAGVRLDHRPELDATLVGLSGYAQAGKDTVAAFLVEEYGFERIAFADALREMLYALDPLTWVKTLADDGGPDYYNDSVQPLVDQHGWEWAKAHSGVRQLLQRLGTEAGRNVLGDDIWVRTALSKVQAGGRYVISDVRFPNEAEAVKAAGGLVWRIERPGTAAVNTHPSETALDHWDYDDKVLNGGSFTALECDVVRALSLAGLTGSCQTRQVP